MTTGSLRLLCCTVTVSRLRATAAAALPERNNDPESTQEPCYIRVGCKAQLREIIGLKFCVLQLPGSQESLLAQSGITLAAAVVIFI